MFLRHGFHKLMNYYFLAQPNYGNIPHSALNNDLF
jgi:hypothetical protein